MTSVTYDRGGRKNGRENGATHCHHVGIKNKTIRTYEVLEAGWGIFSQQKNKTKQFCLLGFTIPALSGAQKKRWYADDANVGRSPWHVLSFVVVVWTHRGGSVPLVTLNLCVMRPFFRL